MKPLVRRSDDQVQLSYDQPYRIYVAQVYPVPAPNGSTIIICGHEGGLLLIWRGGRPLKPSKSEPEKKPSPPKVNGTSNAIISLDSDDEDIPAQPSQPYVDEPEYEEEENEFDSSEPYEPIIQTLELPLGTDVLHLSFPQLPSGTKTSNLDSLPKMLSEKILVAVACADYSVHIITIPLAPPSSKSKARPELRKALMGALTGKGLFGEHMVVVAGGTGHQSIPKGVSVTLGPHLDIAEDDMEMDDPEREVSPTSRTGSHTRQRSRSYEDKRSDEERCDILVASHSADVSGLLLIHRIPLLHDGSGMDLSDFNANIPWRTQYLASHAMSIHFNSSPYPASQHSYLLVVERNGIVRIFDCLQDPSAERGSWLITLYTQYQALGSDLPRRKQILAAQWVLGGKAIAVLLADGDWGIWDLEDQGPKNKKDTDPWQASTGVDLSKFTITGQVGRSSTARESDRSPAVAGGRSRLAPMTPGTRKVRQETLFTGPASKSAGPARGGISVLPIADRLNHRGDDETVLFWHGDSILILPSLLAHWQNKVQGSGNLLGAGARAQAKKINNVHIGGEMHNAVSLIPQHSHTTAATTEPTWSGILVTGEHRFVVVAPPLTEPPASAAPRLTARSEAADQALLARGELDVNGIDNLLHSMTNGHQTNGMSKHELLSI